MLTKEQIKTYSPQRIVELFVKNPQKALELFKGFSKIIPLGEPSDRAQLLGAQDEAGWTPLTLAATFYPAAVEPLCKAIAELDPKEKQMIFGNAKGGYRCVVWEAEQGVPGWHALEADLSIDSDSVQFNVSVTGWHALTLAAAYSPTAVEPLCNAMAELYPTNKGLIEHAQKMAMAHKKAGRNLPETPEKTFTQALLFDQLGVLLKSLEPSDLYNSLNDDLTQYRNSNRMLLDMQNFHRAWDKKITDARSNDVLKGSPDKLQVLKKIACLLSVIGILYLGYKAYKNAEKSRSLFFPSTTEAVVNKLDDAKDELLKLRQDGEEIERGDSELPPPQSKS